MSIGEDSPSLGNLHYNLANRMQLEGFQAETPEKIALGASTITYRHPYDPPRKSLAWKVKNRLGLNGKDELHDEEALEFERDDIE